MNLLILIFAFWGTYSFAAPQEIKNISKEYRRVQLQASAGNATLTLPTGSYSDPGFTLSGGYFFLSKFSLNAHYFLTVSPSGASNMNGFGVQAKYYFYNTETSFELLKGNSRIRSFDRYFAFASFLFLDRDVRTSRFNLSYSGFGLSLGGGYKLDNRNSVGIEITRGNLESPAGSAANTEATFTNFAIFYSYFI